MRLTLIGTAITSQSVGAAAERFNLANAALEASLRRHPSLGRRVETTRLDLPIDLDDPRLPEDAVDRVIESAPDVVGLSCYAWDLDALLGLAAAVKANAPGVRVVAGGPSATFQDAALLAPGSPVDAVVRGEGEVTLAALLERGARRLDGVDGLTWRDDHGELRVEPDRPLVADLDALPSPLLEGVLEPPRENLVFELSRGCRRRCAYCAWKLRGGAPRCRSEARIASELSWAVAHGYDHAFIIDSAINHSAEHLANLARAARRADPKRSLALSFFVDAAGVTPDQVRDLSALRPHEMTVGLESMTPEAARAAGRRPVDLEAFGRSLDLLSEVAPATLSIILGMPGDTLEGFRTTLDVCARLSERPGRPRVRAVRVFWMLVAPGSALSRRAARLGLTIHDGPLPYLIGTPTFPRKDLLAAMRALHDHPRADLFTWDDADPARLLGADAPRLGGPSGHRLEGAAAGAEISPSEALDAVRPLRPGRRLRDGFVVAPVSTANGFPVIALVGDDGRPRARLQLRPAGSEPTPHARTARYDLVWLPSGRADDREERLLIETLAKLVAKNDRP